MNDQVSPSSPADSVDGTFTVGQAGWLSRLGNLRNVVRQELISRQLSGHLPPPPARILDVGAGQGTQAIRGYHVTAVEPDAEMRDRFLQEAEQQPAEVQDRVLFFRLSALVERFAVASHSDVSMAQMLRESSQGGANMVSSLACPKGTQRDMFSLANTQWVWADRRAPSGDSPWTGGARGGGRIRVG
jgi:hypothetical protein